MKEVNIIDEIKTINILIGKKMFSDFKIQDIKSSPSPLQFKILKYMLENKESTICQRDLEQNLNVSKATISEVLLTMEKNGIISRSSSKLDSRSKIIELTNNSINRFKEMQNIATKINEDLTKNINKEDLSTFLLVINQMKKNIEKREDNK